MVHHFSPDCGYWLWHILMLDVGGSQVRKHVCWQKEEGWHVIYLNCTIISLFEKLTYKCIYREFCACLSMAVLAVLIYRQLYLVVMLFWDQNGVFVWHGKRLVTHSPLVSMSCSLLFILSFTFLLGQMQYLLAVSVPHLSPFSGLT